MSILQKRGIDTETLDSECVNVESFVHVSVTVCEDFKTKYLIYFWHHRNSKVMPIKKKKIKKKKKKKKNTRNMGEGQLKFVNIVCLFVALGISIWWQYHKESKL